MGTTIFSVMTRMAQAHKALNLAQGFPDFDCGPALKARVHHHMQLGANQYAPMPGVLALREAIARKTERFYGAQYDQETEVTVTAGATQALFTLMQALVHPGDEVIVLEPAYDSYVPAIMLAGGKPVFVPMRPPTFQVPWDDVRRAITPHTVAILVNSPNNPTGAQLSAEDVDELARIANEANIWVVSDEVYEHIAFAQPHRCLGAHPALRHRTVVVCSFGKTYHVTGWKVGYVLAPPALTVEFRKVHQYNVFSVSTPMQWAFADALASDAHPRELPDFYRTKRDRLLAHLQGSPLAFLPAASTYFQLVDYQALSTVHDAAFAELLARRYGIALIPVSAFYHNQQCDFLLRICFAKSDAILDKAGLLLHNLADVV